jgi:hypothetical protein
MSARVRGTLSAIVGQTEHTTANRLSAVDQFAAGLEVLSEGCFIELAGTLEAGPVLAAVLRKTGKRPKLAADAVLVRELKSPAAVVRAAAVVQLHGQFSCDRVQR